MLDLQLPFLPLNFFLCKIEIDIPVYKKFIKRIDLCFIKQNTQIPNQAGGLGNGRQNDGSYQDRQIVEIDIEDQGLNYKLGLVFVKVQIENSSPLNSVYLQKLGSRQQRLVGYILDQIHVSCPVLDFSHFKTMIAPPQIDDLKSVGLGSSVASVVNMLESKLLYI